MTRKHFQLIADTIYRLDMPIEEKRVVAGEFAYALSSTYCNFDKLRFISACLDERQPKRQRHAS